MAPPARHPPEAPAVARDLAADLKREVRGDVRFDSQARMVYATDASNYRLTPVGVVFPRDADDVEAALAVCRRHGAAVLPRGGGTSLAGQATNTAVVLDLSRHLTRVMELDPETRTARVEPGVVLDSLQSAAARHGLRFGPDPSTHASCTLGGMIGNNACGVHSLRSGRTSDNVESLTALTADGHRLTLAALDGEALARRIAAGGREGEILDRLRDLGTRAAPLVETRFPDIPRRVSGFNLDDLLPGRFHPARSLVGSEGTCVTVIEATVRLVPRPTGRALLLLAYPTLVDAASAVPAVLGAASEVARELGWEALVGLEGLDRHLLDNPHVRRHLPGALELFPEGQGCLLAELASFEPDAAAGTAGSNPARAAGEALQLRLAEHAAGARLLTDLRAQGLAWKVREAGLGTTSRHPVLGDTAPGWEDPAVAPERLGAYVAELQGLLDRFGLAAALYGHFGDGCLHARIGFDLGTRDGVARYRDFVEEAADLLVGHGGSLSGEHGDGQARGELLPRMFGPELVAAFEEFKSIWDPEGRMNPGKVVRPRPLDADLAGSRAPGHDPEAPVGASAAWFGYPEDGGSFARAAGRCVGVGKCRRTTGGVMCPSFRATGAEEHSTRGRARLLEDMLRGEARRATQTSGSTATGRDVKEALDLCLACKGCKSDCPVSVDMATYKAEFLARWYRFRPRPRSAYALGWIFRWARFAARFPGFANGVMASSTGSRILKHLAGVAPDRRLPRFAAETFSSWFARRPEPTGHKLGRMVVLWPDTFTNHFQPHIARAAVLVLEAAGFEVSIPRRPLCCGRPLYDYGFLRQARRQLRRVLNTLHPEIAAGVPVVGLEPSCIATFRDEMPALLHGDPAAQDLSGQAFLLGQLLEKEAPDLLQALDPPDGAPAPGGRALLHGHCHQKSVLGGMETDRLWLERLGFEVAEPAPGCCGMAGAFGFESRHVELARACGELELLPAVREAADTVELVADGFSCREQIAQETGRKARHLAEVLARALAEVSTIDCQGPSADPLD